MPDATPGLGVPWQNKSALVVDDYPAVRKTIKDILNQLGVKVTEAEHGLEALEILKNQTMDIVLTDLVMPEMDGFELTEAIKNSTGLRTLPVVVISTHADTKYIFKALKLGADDYLTKPPTTEMVKTVLARIFDYEWQ